MTGSVISPEHEYEQLCLTLRHYSTLRWLILPVFVSVIKICDLGLADRRILKGLLGRYFAYWCKRAFDGLAIDQVEHKGW